MWLPNFAFVKKVTVEPVMIIYYITIGLSSLSGYNLIIQKVCHPGYSVPAATTKCPNEIEAQKIVIEIQTWKIMITYFVPVFFILFAGPWSDNHGKRRKPLMYLPLCGQILSDVFCIVNVYFWQWSPIVAALSQSVLPSFTGWKLCFVIGANSYVADITSEKSRTVRLGICSITFCFGIPIGFSAFGLVFNKTGFCGVFLFSVILNIGALIYLFLCVEDNKPDENLPKLKAWEGMIDSSKVLQSLKTTFKPRNGYQRAIVLMMIIAAPITMAPIQGEFSVIYLFLRYKFNWNEVDYGYYEAYRFFVMFFGTAVTLGIFSRLLEFSDAIIGVMSSVTLILASVGYTFSSMTWELFFYPIVDFMQGAGLAVVYSIVSKSIEHTELGQVNSMIGVADALFPLLILPIYNQVYNHTFTVMPGAVFLVSVVTGIAVLIIFGVIYILQRLQSSREVQTAKSNH